MKNHIESVKDFHCDIEYTGGYGTDVISLREHNGVPFFFLEDAKEDTDVSCGENTNIVKIDTDEKFLKLWRFLQCLK